MLKSPLNAQASPRPTDAQTERAVRTAAALLTKDFYLGCSWTWLHPAGWTRNPPWCCWQARIHRYFQSSGTSGVTPMCRALRRRSRSTSSSSSFSASFGDAQPQIPFLSLKAPDDRLKHFWHSKNMNIEKGSHNSSLLQLQAMLKLNSGADEWNIVFCAITAL